MPMLLPRYNVSIRNDDKELIVDDALYFTDSYIDYLVRTNQKNLIILVSSWSESMVEHARSINLGSRQCRDLVHHILLAQRLRKRGINLEVKYFSFDNAMHYNYKNIKAKDNTISKSFMDYICCFLGIRLGVELDAGQFQAIYLNPRFTSKQGDYISAELPDQISRKGHALFCSGPNAKKLESLRNELALKKQSGYKILGMTVHSGGPSLREIAEYLGTELIGMAPVNQELGTKPGNKQLFMEEPVEGGVRLPIAYGTKHATKDLEQICRDCFRVAEHTKAKRLVIKLTSSSAGNGNVFVDLTECYSPDGTLNYDSVRSTVLKKLQEVGFIDKVKIHGAIVEERLEGKNITSPGVLAVVTKSGQVKVLYIYDQVLGDGNFFGGSIGPTLEDDDIKEQIRVLTEEAGRRIHRRGGHGYFGLDFFTREVLENGKIVKKVDVIEANIRKTGTLYPWLSALHLLGENLINKKTISQDDKIALPLKVSDLTGRKDMKNLYMSGLYKYLSGQSATKFNHDTKTGAFVTFNTHTADKIGVLFIGNSRDHIDSIKAKFNRELEDYTFDIFISNIARRSPQCQDITSLQDSLSDTFKHTKISAIRQEVESGVGKAGVIEAKGFDSSNMEISSFTARRDYFAVATRRVKHSASDMYSECVDRIEGLAKICGVTPPSSRVGSRASSRASSRAGSRVGSRASSVSSSSRPGSRANSPVGFRQQTDSLGEQLAQSRVIKDKVITRSPDQRYGDTFILGIFGRTNSNNDLLIEAAKQGKLAYRFTADSEFWFSREQRQGKIKNIYIALYDKGTKKYIVKYSDDHWFDLPTVVYNYDFTASRRGVYQNQGDRTISDKVLCVKNFIEAIGAVSFNTEKNTTALVGFVPATRSQLALHSLCSKNELFAELYPDTQSITGIVTTDSPELIFINKYEKFFIKPVFSERKLDSNLGNIFVTKHLDYVNSNNSYLLLTYICKTDDGIFSSETKRINLKGLTVQEFHAQINKIKNSMGYEEDEQFLLQEYLESPEVRDGHNTSTTPGKPLIKKIRVVTQRAIHPTSGEVFVRASSVYGIYGGPNSYLGYLGDPSIYIQRYLASDLSSIYTSCDRQQEVFNDLFERAVCVHNLVEAELGTNARIGEAVVDFILTKNGPVPIKIGTKPERAVIDEVTLQTHMKQFLEGTREARVDYINVLEKNETERNQRVIEYAEKYLHKDIFMLAETARRRSIVGTTRTPLAFHPAHPPVMPEPSTFVQQGAVNAPSRPPLYPPVARSSTAASTASTACTQMLHTYQNTFTRRGSLPLPGPVVSQGGQREQFMHPMAQSNSYSTNQLYAYRNTLQRRHSLPAPSSDFCAEIDQQVLQKR